jgi:glycosyltransferase involved in cell wall biosynthesis
MSKISLIIPVYNVELYLKRTLDSVFEQSADMEVIVIDDGSTDSSATIIDQYRHHLNLRVISQSNRGISGARNAGIEIAQGEYVMFLDSDDRLLPGAVDAFIPYFEAADIVFAQAVQYHLDGTTSLIRHPLENPCSGEAYLRQVLPAGFPVMVWLNAYRKDFLDKHQLRFWQGVVHEDEDFMVRALLMAERVTAAPVLLLNYILRPASFTTSVRSYKSGVDLTNIAQRFLVLSASCSQNVAVGLKKHAVKLYIKAFRYRNVHRGNPQASFFKRFSILFLPMSVSDRLKMLMIVFFPMGYERLFSLKHDGKYQRGAS